MEEELDVDLDKVVSLPFSKWLSATAILDAVDDDVGVHIFGGCQLMAF